ncbi:MAG: hypothetical protein CMD92_07080 [Gammaproteobacteria bacterium]|nr:hypothetical protein [Gammaproteobacteria bacterium]|tara:strand:- start:4294 stop:4833 length:540 start_codon:yes stop_codon:yes gene_type:complete
MEPRPSERFLSLTQQREQAILRATLLERAELREKQLRDRAAIRARMAAAANGVQPGATDLVQAAVTDPNVNPQNFSSWVRSKLPSLSVETKEMLVHALGILFLAAFNAAAQNMISRDEAQAEAEARNRERLGDIFGEVPGMRGLLGGENVLAPCCDDDDSVVDAVFAKAERKTGGRSSR